MKLWQIAALLAAGVVYGIAQPGQLTYAFGHATLYVLLPALLFEASWEIRLRALARTWQAIVVLVIPGVALTVVLIAGALAVVRIPIGAGLIAGAILAATDPISVIAVFRRVRVPLLLRTIVEGESLFNDAIAFALYRAALVAVIAASWTPSALVHVSLYALMGSAAGILTGIAFAFVAALALRNRNDQRLQIAATILCAYGAYFTAEFFDWSGIFATIAAGIALRWLERRWISLSVAEEVAHVWDILALIANALVFFLVGAALNVRIIADQWIFVVAALTGVLFARVALSGLLLPFGYPRAWLDVLRAAGVRGALSLALAIAIPAGVPYREAVVAATFAVALATIVSSVFTVPQVVARAARAR
ncbi:MAG TPA: cation:proton antiporter [Candidatus Acidoferrales bacterium]|nr:cation:proton antiporter [Candidatus Acidoferrales bacterium]